MHLSPGHRIGPYEILGPLGAGGMGAVYRAHDGRLGRDVALKVLPAEVAADPERLERFRREARAVAALNHPHIVTIFSIEEQHGEPFMTMELVEGRSLDRALADGALPVGRFFDIGIALADALSAAHRKRIVHRDVKPANVVVSDDGVVKVLDFGLARAGDPRPAEETPTSLGLTGAGVVVGTVPYMSPEQIEAGPIDHRSDIFSLGVVLYEMATGARPFSGGSSPALMSSILRDRPRPITELRPDLPEGVSRLVALCLKKSPGDRAQSAQEIHAELKALRRSWESGSAPAVGAPAFGRAPSSDLRVGPARPSAGVLAAASPARDGVASIAVMPFSDLSPEKDQEWFCDGIAEEILNALTPLTNLRVAARASAFSLRGRSDDLETIGERLNVTTVLGGSVRRAGDRVRITVQLSDVRDGFQIWSQRYDRELKDIFDVQDDIARAVADRLKVTLADTPLDRLARLVERGTTDVDAYQCYLRGRALLNRRGPSIPAALELFQQAVAIDPEYALAWAGIADAYTVLGYFGVRPPSELKPDALGAARKALQLDPSSAAGHTALACATLLYENNRDLAGQEFERALELNPRYVQGRAWYALFYLQWTRGDFDRGIAEATRALESDPLSAYTAMILAACLFTAGRRDDEALAIGRIAVERDPESFVARWVLGATLVEAERYDEAVATLEYAAAMSGRHPYGLTSMAVAFGRCGKPEAAETLLRELTERRKRSYVAATQLIGPADAAGHRDLAIQYAERAWAEREPPFILFARHFPEFRSLRADPRFQAILREMDGPVEEPR